MLRKFFFDVVRASVVLIFLVFLACNGESPNLPDTPRPPRSFRFDQFGTSNLTRSQVLFVSHLSLLEEQRFPLGQKLTALWDNNTESDLAGYNVYIKKAAAEAIKINAGRNSFLGLPTLFPGFYSLTVTAYDAANNESTKSENVDFEIYSIEEPDTSALDSLFDSFDFFDSTKWTRGNNSKNTVKVSSGRLVLTSVYGESGWVASRRKLKLSGHIFKMKLQGTGDFAFGISKEFDASSKVGFYNKESVRFYIAVAGETCGLWYQERRDGKTIEEKLVAIDQRFKTSEVFFEIRFTESDSTFWRYSLDGNIWREAFAGNSFFKNGPIVHIEFTAHKSEVHGIGYINEFSFKTVRISKPPEPPVDSTLVKVPIEFVAFWFIVKPDSFDTRGAAMNVIQIGIDAEVVRFDGGSYLKTIYPPSPKKNIYYIHRDSLEVGFDVMKRDTLKFGAFQRNPLNGKQSFRVPNNKRFIF